MYWGGGRTLWGAKACGFSVVEGGEKLRAVESLTSRFDDKLQSGDLEKKSAVGLS